MARPRAGRAMPAINSASRDDEKTSNERTPLENLPETDANGNATFPVSLAKPPTSSRPQEAQIFVRMAESRRPRRRAQTDDPGAAGGGDDRRQTAVQRQERRRRRPGQLRRRLRCPGRQALARDGLRYELLKLESRYQWYRQGSSWEYEPVKSTKRVADGDLSVAADKPARIKLSPQPGRYRLDVKSTDADGALTSITFDVGWYSEGSADTPDLLETSIDKAGVSVRRHHGGEGQRAHRRQADHQRLGDRLLTTQSVDVKEGTVAGQHPGRQGLGHRRLCGGDAAPAARRRRTAHARTRDRAEMVRHRQDRPRTLAGESVAADIWCGPAPRSSFPSRSAG